MKEQSSDRRTAEGFTPRKRGELRARLLRLHRPSDAQREQAWMQAQSARALQAINPGFVGIDEQVAQTQARLDEIDLRIALAQEADPDWDGTPDW